MTSLEKSARAVLLVTALVVTSAGCTKETPTLEDWNSALADVVDITSVEAQPDGSSLSEACIETRNDEPCIPVTILRNPFEKLRVIRPTGQQAQRADRARLVPYILINDGDHPSLTIAADYPRTATAMNLLSGRSSHVRPNRPRIAIVLDGDLAYETPNVDTPLGPMLFMPDATQWEHLKGIKHATQVQARIYYTPLGEYSEEALSVNPQDSSQFASELRAMMAAQDSLSRALKSKITINATTSRSSSSGEPDRARIVGWSD